MKQAMKQAARIARIVVCGLSVLASTATGVLPRRAALAIAQMTVSALSAPASLIPLRTHCLADAGRLSGCQHPSGCSKRATYGLCVRNRCGGRVACAEHRASTAQVDLNRKRCKHVEGCEGYAYYHATTCHVTSLPSQARPAIATSLHAPPEPHRPAGSASGDTAGSACEYTAGSACENTRPLPVSLLAAPFVAYLLRRPLLCVLRTVSCLCLPYRARTVADSV